VLKPGKRPREVSAPPRIREALEFLARRPSTPQKVAKRARIVLAALEGQRNADIARALATHENIVCKWRRRWAQAQEEVLRLAWRLEPDATASPLRKLADALAEEILSDAARSGAPPRIHGGAAVRDRRAGLSQTRGG
jgi:hypothetical protein